MPRALASLTLSFGLVSIPVRLYNATEPAPGVRFRLLTPEGRRIRQQYVEDAPEPIRDAGPGPEADLRRSAADEAFGMRSDPAIAPVMPRQTTPVAAAANVTAFAGHAAQAERAAQRERGAQPERAAQAEGAAAARHAHAQPAEPAESAESAESAEPAAPAVARERLLKGYEFEKGRFVTFTSDELEALASPRRDTIDIVAFVPEHAVDPVYHEKAYYLAPERRGARPYALLLEALRESRRSAIAKWAWRGKETIAEIRPASGGLVVQQLRYADEVRRIEDLHIELEPVGRGELALALQLVEQNAEARFDPQRYVNEEEARIRAAIEQKVAGRRIVETAPAPARESAQVIDLMGALRASLRRGLAEGEEAAPPRRSEAPRKPPRRVEEPPRKPVSRAKSGGAPVPTPAGKRRPGR